MGLTPHYPVKYGFDGTSPPPVPEEHAREGRFSASFDQRLWMFHRRWEPHPDTQVKATLMIVHGTVDHSGVYSELAQKLAKAGIAVFAMDMRGWGLSDGESMYVDDMNTFVEDVEALYQQIHTLPRYEKVKPRFLLGKSLGGTVTAFCAAKYPQHWTGLLGLSGAYEADPTIVPSPLVTSVLNYIVMILPKLPVKELFDEHLIVSDEQALQNWRDDPLCSKDKVRVGYIVSLLHCLNELPETIVPKLNLPMLMMCGDADRVVTQSGHELMIHKSPPQPKENDKQLKIYKKGYHNLLQEPALKTQVMADIQEWILAHL